MNNINDQKQLVNTVLNLLQNDLNLECIVAGGCPRNWYLSKLANDVDVYILNRNIDFVNFEKKILSISNLPLEEVSEYPGHDFKLCNAFIKGLKFQFIFVSEPLSEIILKFSNSISKIYITNKSPSYIVSTDFLFSIENKIILFENFIENESQIKYFNKIKNYFPDYVLLRSPGIILKE